MSHDQSLQIVGTLADMLLNSTFQPDAIEREKKTILQVDTDQ